MRSRSFSALAAGFLLVVSSAPAVTARAADAPHVVNGQISFTRYDPALNDTSIWVADASGQHEHRLTADQSGTSDWSPDGRWIAFDHNDDTGEHLAVVRPDGTDRRALTSTPGIQEGPSWSPDGRQIAFDAGDPDQPVFSTSIWLMNADGTHQRQVTRDGFDVEPAFGPDGTRIAFARIIDDANGVEAIYIVNTDGTGLREVVPPTPGLEHPKWSPDGRWIAFNIAPEMSSPDAGGVLLVHPDGTGLHVVRAAEPQLLFFKPRWSPDGRLFLSGCFDRSVGRDRLCISNSDGAGHARVVPLPGTEDLNIPAWGPRPRPAP